MFSFIAMIVVRIIRGRKPIIWVVLIMVRVFFNVSLLQFLYNNNNKYLVLAIFLIGKLERITTKKTVIHCLAIYPNDSIHAATYI